MSGSRRARFAEAYARVRAAEGRGAGGAPELLALPYLREGPLARQWAVRARTFDAFLARVVAPLERRTGRPLAVLDLGAGNGWLSAALARRGHRAVALDLRTDAVDGLAAAEPFRSSLPRMIDRVAASFEAIPFRGRPFDLALFDASLHYAEEIGPVLAEAVRCVAPGGAVAILDSPFYRRASAGEVMAREKRRALRAAHPEIADALLAVEAVEYLTAERLRASARPLGLSFRRRRVLYPLWYEARAALALLRRARSPSRFDLWTAEVP